MINRLGDINNSFVKRSFSYWYNPERNSNGLSFKGYIKTTRWGNLSIEFNFHDKSLTKFPKAYILDRNHSDLQPYHFPHLDSDWSLCFDSGILIFDKNKPETMISYCINKVTDILNRIQLDDMEEIIPEFFSYWDGLKYYGDIERKSKEVFFDSKKFISNNINIWKINISDCLKFPIFKIREIYSLSEVNWPIQDFESLEKWLKKQPEVFRNIKRFIKKRIKRNTEMSIVIIYSEKQNLYFGLNIITKSPLFKKRRKKELHNYTVEILF